MNGRKMRFEQLEDRVVLSANTISSLAELTSLTKAAERNGTKNANGVRGL